MRVFHIFWREYWGNITRRSYLIFTFGFPLFMVAVPVIFGIALGLALRLALPQADPRPIGVIDSADILTPLEEFPPDPVEMIFFPNPQSAGQALDQEVIQAYYHIQPDYWQSGRIIITYRNPPTEAIDNMVVQRVEAQVRAKVPPELLTRLLRGPVITHHGLAEEAVSFMETDTFAPVLVYLVLYFVRLAGSFTASYMFDSIANEANDRTLEIMLTSVSPLQFVIGKLLGLLAVGLTQIGTWAAAILALGLGVTLLLDINLLGALLTWEHLGLMLNILLATYLMDQILAAAMGLLRVSGGAGNLLFSTINGVVGISLIYAAYFVPRNPNTPLAVAASLFPLTSPLVLLIRVVVSQVPPWQIGLSLLFLWGTNVLGVFWLRHLLRANLIANRNSFNMRDWLREKRRRFQGVKSLGQELS